MNDLFSLENKWLQVAWRMAEVEQVLELILLR